MSRTFRCEECGHVFSADVGGEGSEFEVYRCDECGRVLRAERYEDMPEMLEESCGCGGTFWRGRPPLCPSCRSPDVVGLD